MMRRPFKELATIGLSLILMINPVSVNASSIDQKEAVSANQPEIVATAAVVFDANTSAVLYDKHKDQQMYPASITKIMTALLAIEAFEREDEILFTEEAVTRLRYNSSSIGARPEEILTLDQTLHALMLMSANEAAIALAEERSGSVEGFAIEMNNKAQELGAVNSHFVNSHGLFDVAHFTTAYDMALITAKAIESPYFLEIMSHSTYEIAPTNKCDETRYLAQKHKMLSDKRDMRIYREDVIAGKQGYITESGHTLVTVADNGERRLVVVILESDANNLYKDTEKLIEYGYSAEPIEEVTSEIISLDKDLLEEEKEVVASILVVEASEDSLAVIEPSTIEENEKAISERTEGNSPLKTVLMWVFVGLVGLAAILIFDQRLSRLRRIRKSQRHRT